jgi:hypothetical protein
LELSKYGGGGWHSFAIVPEGRDGSGWGNCLSQMSCLEKYYEKRGACGTWMAVVCRGAGKERPVPYDREASSRALWAFPKNK